MKELILIFTILLFIFIDYFNLLDLLIIYVKNGFMITIILSLILYVFALIMAQFITKRDLKKNV